MRQTNPMVEPRSWLIKTGSSKVWFAAITAPQLAQHHQ
jgi:hypothetical protein